MKELGENPADFDKLRDSLRRAFAPHDGFEQMLVEDMAELRWRRLRLLRAEAGILASKKRKFELDHEWGVARRGQEAKVDTERFLLSEYALSGLPDSPDKYPRILEMLRGLREAVEIEGFQEDGLEFLEVVYRKKPGVAALSLKADFERYQKQQEAGDAALQKRSRELFVMELGSEIESFERLARLSRERDEHLTEPMKDAQLLLCQEDLDKIMRYEAALERQFERELQQSVAWGREKRQGGEKEAPKHRAGDRHEA